MKRRVDGKIMRGFVTTLKQIRVGSGNYDFSIILGIQLALCGESGSISDAESAIIERQHRGRFALLAPGNGVVQSSMRTNQFAPSLRPREGKASSVARRAIYPPCALRESHATIMPAKATSISNARSPNQARAGLWSSRMARAVCAQANQGNSRACIRVARCSAPEGRYACQVVSLPRPISIMWSI